MDPAELRRKNFVQEGDWPYTSPTGLAYDSGNYVPTLDKALEMSGYEQAVAAIQQWNQENPRVRKGIGLAAYVEIAGWGPGQATFGLGVMNQLFGSATVRVDRSGTVEVLAGASGHGQGHLTSWAQIAAEVLGIGHEDVRVYEGDTALIQTGTGTFASRSVSVDGAGVHLAAQKVREKMLKIAAHQLEVDPADLEIHNGMITVRGVPLDEDVVAGGRLQTAAAAADPPNPRSVTFKQIAYSANTHHDMPDGLEAGLNETAFFDPVNFTYPFGVHVAEVEVDTETGEVKLTRYVAVDDCGNVINPMIVDGQVHGGVVQGVAQALWEEVVYNEDGQLVTGTLMDYAVPFASDLPMIETGATITPSPVNPLGVKGVGEAGTIVATPVVVNAVMDALSGLGIQHIDMPLRPEKIWQAVQHTQPRGSNGHSEGGTA
jgi:carbon-monoxide dehydrogenase large subunit